MPLCNNLTELYKSMLTELHGLQFRQSDSIKQWLQRVEEIQKLEKDFAKVERMTKSEIQPKKQFELKEKMRIIYDKIGGLK